MWTECGPRGHWLPSSRETSPQNAISIARFFTLSHARRARQSILLVPSSCVRDSAAANACNEVVSPHPPATACCKARRHREHVPWARKSLRDKVSPPRLKIRDALHAQKLSWKLFVWYVYVAHGVEASHLQLRGRLILPSLLLAAYSMSWLPLHKLRSSHQCISQAN